VNRMNRKVLFTLLIFLGLSILVYLLSLGRIGEQEVRRKAPRKTFAANKGPDERAQGPAEPNPPPDTSIPPGRPGIVLDGTNDTPVAGAIVTIDGFEDKAEVTNNKGAFGIPAGRMPRWIRVVKEGYVPATFKLRWRLGSNGPDEDVVLRVFPAVPFRGKVVDSEQFEPVAGAAVRFVSFESAVLREVRTDEKGEFALNFPEIEVNLVEGLGSFERQNREAGILLEVRAEGFAPYYAWDRKIRPSQIRPGMPKALVVLDPEVSFDGVVLDPAGRPVEGAQVLWAWQVVNSFLQMARLGPRALTDRQGRFVWRGPKPVWRSTIVAFHPHFAPGWVTVLRPFAFVSEPVTITLRPTGKLVGRVVDSEGRGIPGAKITVRQTGGAALPSYLGEKILREFYGPFVPGSAESDEDGEFVLSNIGQGKYELHVFHKDFVPAPGSQSEILIGPETFCEVKMVPGRCITCVVTTAGGDPVPEARLRILAKRKTFWAGILQEDFERVQWDPIGVEIRSEGPGVFIACRLPWDPVKIQARACDRLQGEALISKEEEAALIVMNPVEKKRAGNAAGAAPSARTALLLMELNWQGYVVNLKGLKVDFYEPGTSRRVYRANVDVIYGSAVLKQAPVGVFDLVLRPQGFEPVFLDSVRIPLEDGLRVDLVEAEPLLLKIEAPGPVNWIAVRDCENREVRKCLVELGGTAFLCGIAPGRYTVEGRGPDGESYVSAEPVYLPEASEVRLIKADRQQEAEED